METVINSFKLESINIQKHNNYLFYSSIEAPKGEMSCICNSKNKKYSRLKLRTPGFYNLQSYSLISKNNLLSDSLAILGSYDIVLGEINK